MAIRDHFAKHFLQEQFSEITLPMGVFKRLGSYKALELERLHDEEVIKEAVKSCESIKAPIYDGFNMRFVKQIWDNIGKDAVSFVKNFFITCKFPSSINQYYLGSFDYQD